MNLTILVFTISIFLPHAILPIYADTNVDNKSVKETYNEDEKVRPNAEKDIPFQLDENSESKSIQPLKNQFGFIDFLNVLFALFLVLLLLYVTLRFIKKKNQTFGLTKNMMNLGGTSLGGNRSVQLVKIGDRILVVGVGEDIQLLKEIDSKEEVQHILSEQQNDFQQMLQPTDIFNKIITKIKESIKDRDVKNESFKAVLDTQLKDLSKGRKKLMQELERKGNKSNE